MDSNPTHVIPTIASSEKRIGILRRTAREVRSYRVQMRILTLLLVLLLIATGILYGIAALYKKTGSFTVILNKYDMIEYGLTLSESRDMSHSNSHLNANISEEMTNIAGETIPANVDMIDGEHNGRDYIAYTCKTPENLPSRTNISLTSLILPNPLMRRSEFAFTSTAVPPPTRKHVATETAQSGELQSSIPQT